VCERCWKDICSIVIRETETKDSTELDSELQELSEKILGF
jgi:hypothetical protein